MNHYKDNSETSFFKEVYSLIKKVPKGKVTSYGRIAALLGKPRAARAVGYALNALPKGQEQKVPWQRVINSQGKISFRGDTSRSILQKKNARRRRSQVRFYRNDRLESVRLAGYDSGKICS